MIIYHNYYEVTLITDDRVFFTAYISADTEEEALRILDLKEECKDNLLGFTCLSKTNREKGMYYDNKRD